MKIPNALTKLFTNKYFLYVVVALSAITNLGYLYSMQINSLAFFFLVGLITFNFSKNMAIVLTTSLLASFVFITGNKMYEGFEKDMEKDEKDVKKDEKDVKKDEKDVKKDEKDVKKDAKQEVYTKPNTKGGAALSGAPHPNVDDILNPDAIKNLTAETMELMGEQKKLFASMNNMAPLLEQAKSLLAGFDMKQLNSLAALSKNAGVAADAAPV